MEPTGTLCICDAYSQMKRGETAYFVDSDNQVIFCRYNEDADEIQLVSDGQSLDAHYELERLIEVGWGIVPIKETE